MFNRNVFLDIERLIFQSGRDCLNVRDEHKERILAFLQDPNFDTTLRLYHFIAEVHQKGRVFNLMNVLRIHEEGFAKILSDHREHYLHSASVYVLGLAIYNNCGAIRGSLNTGRHEPSMSHEQKTSFMFRWSLAACLHDLAYPLELSLKSFNRYSAYLSEIKGNGNYSFAAISPEIYERFKLLPILDPSDNIHPPSKRDTALGLIAQSLISNSARSAPITYETLLGILKKHLRANLASGRIDHGAFSSFITLKRIHELYRKEGWDVLDYYYEVVEASTAIFLHNFYAHSELKDIFGNGKFQYDYPSPLGYLLYVTDTLCEWLRGKKRDYKSFGVYVNDGMIVFRMPRATKSKIKPAAELFDERIPIKITDKWYT